MSPSRFVCCVFSVDRSTTARRARGPDVPLPWSKSFSEVLDGMIVNDLGSLEKKAEWFLKNSALQ